ncbi:prohibitin-2 [Platysternon megacephalum]|uniref:Prohibitin-2 n=1 Tax=Platysternon megacephalum TaxID=55544 RepID=A0A4D9E3D4_9SAUR|nr:prohibitin-2 [Platysternon megacephalum]
MKFQYLPQGVYSLSPTVTLTLQTLVMCRLKGHTSRGLYRQGTSVFCVRWVMLERASQERTDQREGGCIMCKLQRDGNSLAAKSLALQTNDPSVLGANVHTTTRHKCRPGSSRSQSAFARHKQSD